MNSRALLNGVALFLFLFTLLFCYAYRVLKPLMEGYTYAKCFTGGAIIGIILLEVLPDIYSAGSQIPPVVTGISFFLLFFISKLYIERVNAEEQDSIPTGASKQEAMIFIFALSLHSFMEGLGMGNKKDEKLIYYMVSIFIHKWLEAIVLGTSVLTSSFSPAVSFVFLVIYSSLTSIGALIGWYINALKQGDTSSTALMCLDGTAAGSFLYIGFVEMVGNEFETSSYKNSKSKTLKKIISMFIGFLLIIATHQATHSADSMIKGWGI